MFQYTTHISQLVDSDWEESSCLVDLVLTLMVDTTKDARRSRRSEIQVCKHRAAFDEIQSAYRLSYWSPMSAHIFSINYLLVSRS